MSVDEEIVIRRKTVFVRVEETPVLGERGPKSRAKGGGGQPVFSATEDDRSPDLDETILIRPLSTGGPSGDAGPGVPESPVGVRPLVGVNRLRAPPPRHR
jgi:hypothetical protein